MPTCFHFRTIRNTTAINILGVSMVDIQTVFAQYIGKEGMLGSQRYTFLATSFRTVGSDESSPFNGQTTCC